MKLNVMAAVPSHSGTMVMEGVTTLLELQTAVLRRGGAFRFVSYGGATISLVRNAIAAEFLESASNLLLMIDADQGIEVAALERMIDLDQPVVGCLSPKRLYKWAQVGPVAAGADPDLIPAQALEFAGLLEADESGNVPVSEGFAPAEHVGAGILLVQRRAFEQLMREFPELKGRGFGPDAYPWLRSNWGFFNPLEAEDGLPLSEDLSFCRRWRQTGGRIWADVQGMVLHAGLHKFRGSYVNSWQAHRRTDDPGAQAGAEVSPP